MMNSIEEEEEQRNERSKSRESIKKGQLNMAELRKQHDELKEKINESKQKVLEEGLRRQRKSSHQVER